MKVELVDQARKILFTSWAARLGVLAAVLQALAEFQDQLPLIRDYVPHNVFSLLAVLCAVAVPLARIVKQQSLHDAVVEATKGETVAQELAAVQVIRETLTAHNAPPPPPVVQAPAVLTAHTAPPPPAL